MKEDQASINVAKLHVKESMAGDSGHYIVPEMKTLEEQQVLGGTEISILSFFRKFMDRRTLTSNDLQPVFIQMKEMLIKKNVAAEVAERLCNSVVSPLEGHTIGALTSNISLVFIST